MNINIICVGKIKESFYRDAIAEYSKRLSRFCKFNIVEVSEAMQTGKSEKDVERVKDIEGKNIISKLKGGAIALDLYGKAVTSPQIAETIASYALRGESEISFIIGGSFGLSQEVKSICKESFCFGNVTYPHQLMRVILAEQIYRAFMINEGAEYHK